MRKVIELRPEAGDSAVIEAVHRYSEARAAFDAARLVDAPERDKDAAYDRESRAYDAMMATTPETASGWLALIERILANEADSDPFPSAATPEQISAFLVKLRDYFIRRRD